jgi:F0F1-type ATP synthase epsilon subunit
MSGSVYRTDDISAAEAAEAKRLEAEREFEAGKRAALERQKDPAVAEHVAKLRARDAGKARGSVTYDPNMFSSRKAN